MKVITKGNQELEANIIFTFDIEKNNSQYIVYEIDNKYYGAKYINKDDNAELITDLTDEEKKVINELFLKHKEGVMEND